MNVPVAFICDSNYVIPTAVAITSLISNKNQDTHFDIFIISAGLTDIEIEKFYEFRGNSTDIHIIKSSLEKFEGLHKIEYVTHAAYLKFYLPELISHLDKVLYLDSDVIIQRDLSHLFETDIKDYYAGVIKDVPLIDNFLNIKNYFNSGVMLLNLNLMRENKATEALFNIRKSTKDLMYMDQDCLNIFFNGKVKLLSVVYNFEYNTFFHEKGKFTLEDINNCFGTKYSSLDEIKKASYIIHFAAHYKPWIYYDTVFVHEWDEYFKKSPFKHLNLTKKSAKLIKFIFSNNLITIPYFFFQFWRKNGLIFAIDNLRKNLSHGINKILFNKLTLGKE